MVGHHSREPYIYLLNQPILINVSLRFFIFGSFLALVGSILGALATSVNMVIGAEVLIGIAVAFQQSFFWVVAEIVPMRWRYIANSYCCKYLAYIFLFPFWKSFTEKNLSLPTRECLC